MANLNKIKREPIILNLDKERQLKFTLNSFAEMEDKYGTVDNAIKAMDGGSIKAVRFMLWTGLVHEDKSLTEEAVGDLIDMADMEELADKMSLAMGGDTPDDKDKEEAKTVNPNALTPIK